VLIFKAQFKGGLKPESGNPNLILNLNLPTSYYSHPMLRFILFLPSILFVYTIPNGTVAGIPNAPLSERVVNVPSFSKEIFPIIQQKCNVETCHGGPQKPHFDSYETISKKANRISKRIQHPRRPMPPPNATVQLKKPEIELISRWIEMGAPKN